MTAGLENKRPSVSSGADSFDGFDHFSRQVEQHRTDIPAFFELQR